MANPIIVVLRLKDLSLWLQDPKTLKRVKISKSLFRDFIIFINQIAHEESDNRGPETLGSILKAPGHLKKGQNFKVIISRF